MNIFTALPVPLPGKPPTEIVQTLAESANVRIERIVSEGHTSPAEGWYDQDKAEWVLLVHGAARLEFENSLLELKPGDYVNIPAHCKHRVAWTTPDEQTFWLAVFYD
jgi:cupin 2 domain-containing protein